MKIIRLLQTPLNQFLFVHCLCMSLLAENANLYAWWGWVRIVHVLGIVMQIDMYFAKYISYHNSLTYLLQYISYTKLNISKNIKEIYNHLSRKPNNESLVAHMQFLVAHGNQV